MKLFLIILGLFFYGSAHSQSEKGWLIRYYSLQSMEENFDGYKPEAVGFLSDKLIDKVPTTTSFLDTASLPLEGYFVYKMNELLANQMDWVAMKSDDINGIDKGCLGKDTLSSPISIPAQMVLYLQTGRNNFIAVTGTRMNIDKCDVDDHQGFRESFVLKSSSKIISATDDDKKQLFKKLSRFHNIVYTAILE